MTNVERIKLAISELYQVIKSQEDQTDIVALSNRGQERMGIVRDRLKELNGIVSRLEAVREDLRGEEQ